MKPEEFEAKMKELREQLDSVDEDSMKWCGLCEEVHVKMDDLMCLVLEELGYSAGVKVFKDTDKWYA